MTAGVCVGSVLLSQHGLCRIYALFWSDFDADFYADIEDFVQILCRFLHEKMLVGTSGPHFDNSPHLTHMKTFLVVVHNLQKPIGGPASDTRLTVYIWQPFEARIIETWRPNSETPGLHFGLVLVA